MKHSISSFFTSRRAAIWMLVVYSVLMAVATLVEKFYGTPTAKAAIYYSPIFILLHLLMILNFVGITWKNRLFRPTKLSYAAIHLALIVVLAGALVTHLFSKEGIMHIREGEKTSQVLLKKGNHQEAFALPFEIELLDFQLVRYPGSQSPSSYESYLRIHIDGHTRTEKIYMNNVLDLKGYRFYQASYDPDELGTILSFNHDQAGRRITYFGYTLLFMGLIASLFDPNARFRKLWKQMNRPVAVVLIAMLSLQAPSASAQQALIAPQHAEQFGMLPIQSHHGRIIPANTFASELVRKFKIKKILGNLSADQFLLSVLSHPSQWTAVPIVEVKDENIAAHYGWTTPRISYQDAFGSDGRYKLTSAIEAIYHKDPSERTRHDKEMLKIDDRINLLHALLSGDMLRIFPNPADSIGQRWMTPGETQVVKGNEPAQSLWHSYLHEVVKATQSGDWSEADRQLHHLHRYQVENCPSSLIHSEKLRTEALYNRLNAPRICQFGYLISGILLLVLALAYSSKSHLSKKASQAAKVLTAVILLFFLLHTAALGMRWYISGYAPWSNSYETMLSLAWAGTLCGFIFGRRHPLVRALATLFGGIVLFVSGLNWMDPQITPLVPVLKSPWLMAHVASLVMSYGFLGISCMIGTAYLLLSLSSKPNVKQLLPQLTLINEISLYLGTTLLTIGIFLGAVWANESWGRYWSWDPKETWALITMVVYTAVLHARWFKKSNTDLAFNLASQTAFLSVLMTFLGVNYFLSGMHSYGSHDALANIPWWAYTLFLLIFIVPAALAFANRARTNRRR